MKTPALIAIASLSLITTSLAVDPPPDGGYPINNTAEGDDALLSLTNGTDNTAVGFNVLYNDIGDTSQHYYFGSFNTAVGSQALYFNTNGGWDTAIGDQALFSNVSGSLDTAIGYTALHNNIDGHKNTAVGAGALYSNSNGESNTGIGYDALTSNSSGTENTATGLAALSLNGSGNYNVANGADALTVNYTGNNNTALGSFALKYNYEGDDNTAVGAGALLYCEGSDNIGVGRNAGVKFKLGVGNIAIGNPGQNDDSKTIRLGTRQRATYIAGISGVTVASGVGVMIDSEGRLGTITSSARYKEAIRPMKDASEGILALKPVTFRYKKDLDPKAIPQFGLVAEDVAKVDPDLVARDEEGKPYTVRYEAVNAMLLNEFLKEHKKVEEQTGQLSDQKNEIAELKAALKEQGTQLQDVTARLKANGL